MDPLLRLDQHLSPTLGEDALEAMRIKWKRKYHQYRARFAKLKKRQQDEQERKRACHRVGDVRLAGGGGGDCGGRFEAGAHAGGDEWENENEWRDSYYELVAQMREHELLAPYEEERRASPLAEPPRLLAEACAIYEVVYSEAALAQKDPANPHYYTAFAWHMCGDLLLYVRKARLSRASDPSRALFSHLT